MIIEGLSPGLLPPPPTVQQKLSIQTHLNAYKAAYDFQQRVLGNQVKVIRARVLGFLLLLAPNDISRAEVVKTITSCSDDTALYELGDTYMDFFIRPFKKYKGSRTPVLSYHPSRPSFDDRREEIKKNLLQAPEDHRQAKDRALFRDGYRCIATKIFDKTYIQGEHDEDYPDEQEIHRSRVAPTNCSHIIPESTYFRLSDDKRKSYASSVLVVLDRFGYDIDKINGKKFHSLYNVMTLMTTVHDAFDQLEVWFEATQTSHRYEIKSLLQADAILEGRPPFTTLTTPHPLLPLPDPALLALHATCAKVAHLSGASEYIGRVQRDMERLGVLAEDGGSSEVLLHALYHSAFVDVGA